MPRFPQQHNRRSYQRAHSGCRPTNVDNSSRRIAERNPLTQGEIAAKLGVRNPASNKKVDISKENGKTVVTLVSSEASFRVGYTTHDKAFSQGGSYSSAHNTIAADMPGRYSMKVEKLGNGQFRYTLTMDENLSGAVLDLGREKYVISAHDETQSRADSENGSTPQQKMETLGDYLKLIPLEERSPSDRIPKVLTPGQYFGTEPIPREVLNLRYSDDLF